MADIDSKFDWRYWNEYQATHPGPTHDEDGNPLPEMPRTAHHPIGEMGEGLELDPDA